MWKELSYIGFITYYIFILLLYTLLMIRNQKEGVDREFERHYHLLVECLVNLFNMLHSSIRKEKTIIKEEDYLVPGGVAHAQ